MTGGWLEIELDLREQELPLVESLLETLGVLALDCRAAEPGDALFQEQPGEEPLWGRVHVRALFDAQQGTLADLDQALSALLGRPVETARGAVAERDWVAGFANGVEPFVVGGVLHLVPHGHPRPPEARAVIHLEPGLAFGSGTHPTTRLCLDWLVDAAGAGRLPAELVDYGCGSGVLALSALALGARRAHGVDHDPQALLATRENAERNGVPAEALVVTEPEGLPSGPWPLIVANLLLGPVIELAPHFAELLAPGGCLVVSGVLADQAAEVEAACLPWFEPGPEAEREGWMRLSYRRRPEP